MRKVFYFFIRNNTFPCFAYSCIAYFLWSCLSFFFHGEGFSALRLVNIASFVYMLFLCLLYKRLPRLVSFTIYSIQTVLYAVGVILLTKMVCGTELYLLVAIPCMFLLTAEYKKPRWYYPVLNTLFFVAIAFAMYYRIAHTLPARLFVAERRVFFVLTQPFSVITALLMLVYAGFNTLIILRHINHRTHFLQQELNYSAKHDVLTGLMNRRRTVEIFGQCELLKAQENVNYAICIFDIDNFKRINDTYGHDAGDFVLKSYSKGVLDAFPPPVRVARWGGEEFLIIFPSITTETIFELENVRKRLSETPIVYNGTAIPVTATFGICSSRTLTAATDILYEADQMLLEGKSTGKNRVVVSERF